jgi:pimeloyl-ACP methyl ester carboxylesterase
VVESGRTADGTAFDVHGSDRAPPIVLVHGLGLCRELWNHHLPELAAAHRVVSYDLYGHGDSAPLADEASLTGYSEQLVALLDEVEIERAAIVGFSIGGMINRRAALDHPERIWALAILNSPHDRGDVAQREVETRAARAKSEGAMGTMDAALERWFTPAFLASEPPAAELVRHWRASVDSRSYAEAAWVLAHGVRELTGPGRRLEVPSLVMTCENDIGSTPAMARSIAAAIDGAETVIVPDLRHLGLIEDPAAFTAPLVDFLEKNRPSP